MPAKPTLTVDFDLPAAVRAALILRRIQSDGVLGVLDGVTTSPEISIGPIERGYGSGENISELSKRSDQHSTYHPQRKLERNWPQ